MKTAVAQPHGGALLVGGVAGNAGGGRPKDVLRRACRDAFTDKQGIKFVSEVMAGEVGEQVVVGVGDEQAVVTVPAKIRDRLYAAELLMDRGYGRAEQGITIEDERPAATLEQVGDEELLRVLMARAVRLQRVRSCETALRAAGATLEVLHAE